MTTLSQLAQSTTDLSMSSFNESLQIISYKKKKPTGYCFTNKKTILNYQVKVKKIWQASVRLYAIYLLNKFIVCMFKEFHFMVWTMHVFFRKMIDLEIYSRSRSKFCGMYFFPTSSIHVSSLNVKEYLSSTQTKFGRGRRRGRSKLKYGLKNRN